MRLPTQLLLVAALGTVVASSTAQSVHDEAGAPPIRKVVPRPDARPPQAWASCRAADGSIWLAHSSPRLQRYDGASWSAFETGTMVRSILQGPGEELYYCGFGLVGRAGRDDSGNWALESLHERFGLPEPEVLGDLKRAALVGDRLAFQSPRCTLLLDLKTRRARYWTTEASTDPFEALAVLGGTLHAARSRSGIQELGADGRWHSTFLGGPSPLPRTAALVELDGTPWVVTEDCCLFSEHGRRLDLTEQLGETVALAAHADQGQIHIATARKGLVSVTPGPRPTLRIVDEQCGLPSNKIHALRRDEDGTLWLSTNRGTAIVRTESAWSRFGLADGIHGRPLAMARHDGALHVGTDEGLFRLRPGSPSHRRARFEADPRFPIGCWNLLDFDDTLIACVPPRVIAMRGTKTLTLLEQSATVAIRSRIAPDVLFVGGTTGLFRLRRLQDGWTTAEQIEIPEGRLSDLGAAADGTLWIRAGTSTLLAVRGAERSLRPSVRSWKIPGPRRLLDLPETGDVGLVTGRLVLRLDPEASQDGEIEEVFEKALTLKRTDPGNVLSGTALTDGSVLLSGDRSLQLARPGENPTPITRDFPSRGAASKLLLEDHPGATVVWMVRDDEVLRLSLDDVEPWTAPDRPRVRVTVKEPTSIWESGRGSLRIDVDPIRPGFHGPAQFRFQLAGVDASPRPWRTRTTHQWDRVYSGRHEIEVQMRTADGSHVLAWTVPAQLSRPFRGRPILWWGSLVLLTLLGVFGSRFAARRLRRRNRELADEIAARTRDIETQREAAERSAAWLATTFHRCPAALWDVDGSAIRKALDALIENGAIDLRQHLEAHPDELMRLVETVRLNEVNQVALDIAGAPDLQTLQDRLAQLFTNDTLAMLTRMFQRLATGDTSISERCSLMSLDGRPVHIRFELAIPPGYEHSWKRLIIAILDQTTEIQAVEEARRLESRAHEMSKLEGLGRLAGGVAHDFNNLLTAILGNLDLLKRSVPTVDAAAEATGSIELAARRGAELCEQLLAFSGRGVTEPRPVAVSELVAEMARVLRRSVPENASVTLQLEEDLPELMADPTRLRQIVLNLIVNAAEALHEDGGALVLRTRARELEEPRPVSLGEEVPPGHYLVLEVEDDGCGIPRAVLDRVIDPFYSTKGVGRGLGMAAVVGNLQAQGGHLEIDSEVGEGTLVRIWLPLAGSRGTSDDAAGALDGTAPSPQSTQRPTMVLVIDADADVRRIAVRLLRSANLDAAEASDWERMLADLAEDDPTTLVLVVEESRAATIRQHLATATPPIPHRIGMVIATNEAPGARTHHTQHPVSVAKPFTRQALSEAVERAVAAVEQSARSTNR